MLVIVLLRVRRGSGGLPQFSLRKCKFRLPRVTWQSKTLNLTLPVPGASAEGAEVRIYFGHSSASAGAAEEFNTEVYLNRDLTASAVAAEGTNTKFNLKVCLIAAAGVAGGTNTKFS